MRKKKKKKLFGKKFEIIYVEWAVFTCLMMLCFVPILGNTLGNETTYCEVLLDGSNEIDFWLQLPNSKEAKIEKLTLADLPERPPRTTRLRIKAQPVSDMEVKIRIKDLGFGEIFKSSDKTWEYMMSLENVQ